MRIACLFVLLGFAVHTLAAAPPTTAPTTAPATMPTSGKLPFIQIDAKKRQVRVECEEIDCRNPLEFFCVVTGTNEHESVLRTRARPAQIHLALLMLGLEPGEPVRYSEKEKKLYPPHGPPLKISCEFQKDGKTVNVPAYRMMCDLRTGKEMPPLTWIFAGSRVMDDGNYAADVTGYTVSIVNFDLSMIDIPDIASSANETLAWGQNTKIVPPRGTPVTMIIEPAPAVEHVPADYSNDGGGGTQGGATSRPASQEPHGFAP